MHGATGAVYTGLQEFHDMAFVLHALRPEDLFVDVGANVGSYTILAAGGVGCSVVSVEPVQQTFERLCDNIRFNDLAQKVEAVQTAIGAENGWARVTQDQGSMNRVLESDAAELQSTRLLTLDTLLAGRCPAILKVDVEGFEPQVIEGAPGTLASPALRAILIETSSAVDRQASDLANVDNLLRDNGFSPCSYDGIARKLTVLQETPESAHNTIYVRDPEQMNPRLLNAPHYQVLNHEV